MPRHEPPTASQAVESPGHDALSGPSYGPSMVGPALIDASAQLRAVSDDARSEAEILLTHVLDISLSSLLTHPERPLTSAQLQGYRDLVEQRVSGYPLPYLTGSMEFYGLDMEVTSDVLIPRPETETLVELALAHRSENVIDVGTGSGCIAVALAANLPTVAIVAIDVSRPALSVARRNAERHGVADRIEFVVGDVLNGAPDVVDLIVSNPPYVSDDEWASLPPAIRRHEPRVALDGGADGLAVIRKLLSQSRSVLGPGGALLIEIGANQSDDVRDVAQRVFPGSAQVIRIHPDLAGRDRVLEVRV